MAKTKAETKKTLEFTDFHEMMEALGGLTIKDIKKLKTRDLSLKEQMDEKFEGEEDGYAHIFACHANDSLVRHIAEEFGLQIVTLSIEDSEDEIDNEDEDEDEDEGEDSSDSIFCYSTGMHFVNRERYYFCKSQNDAYCQENF